MNTLILLSMEGLARSFMTILLFLTQKKSHVIIINQGEKINQKENSK